MLILSKHKGNQFKSDQLRAEFNFKMNLNKSKNKTKNRRAGASSLKFHNFVANCASTNASGSNGSTSKALNEQTHCLKEEYGTKQITVSHWRKSLDLASSLTNLSSNVSSNCSPNQSSLKSSPNQTKQIAIKNEEDQKTECKSSSSKLNKAKSFSLLSNSNSLISRSDFVLPQTNSNTSKNFLIKNLITNNSLQYFNGKQKHLNLKQSSSSKSPLLQNRTSPISFKAKQPSNSQLQQLSELKSTNQLNQQLTNLNRFKANQTTQFNEANRSSLNLQQSIDQINQLNLILNDNNLLKANESILSNLLIKENELGGTALENARQSTNKQLNQSNNQINNQVNNQVKTTNRRKPTIVRRLIKVEDDLIDDEQLNCEPLDLSLKKRKLNDALATQPIHSINEPTTSNDLI